MARFKEHSLLFTISAEAEKWSGALVTTNLLSEQVVVTLHTLVGIRTEFVPAAKDATASGLWIIAHTMYTFSRALANITVEIAEFG